MAQEEPEYERRSVERLIFFSDAVVAIAITLLAIGLPTPRGATAAAFWSSVRDNKGAYLAFGVSFVAIAGAWTQHHGVFKYVRRGDARLRNLNLVWLMMIVLIPFATRLLAGYGHSALDVRAFWFGFYALLQTIAAAVMLALVRHMNARDLRADDRPASADGAGWQSYGTLLGFGLSIPVFFATSYGWVLWFAVPALIARLDRHRTRIRARHLRPDPGPRPAAGAPGATLIYLYGPPASGKLTVAEQLSELTGIPLFHNHLTVNAIRPIFGFGTPAFTEASWAMRRAVFEAAAKAGHSLIFTNNSAWSGPDPRARFEEAAEATRRIMAEHGGRTLFVRLTASPAALAARVADESRQAHGKLVDAGRLRELLASFDAAPLHPDDLIIDTERTTPADAARAIAAALG